MIDFNSIIKSGMFNINNSSQWSKGFAEAMRNINWNGIDYYPIHIPVCSKQYFMKVSGGNRFICNHSICERVQANLYLCVYGIHRLFNNESNPWVYSDADFKQLSNEEIYEIHFTILSNGMKSPFKFL